MNTSTINVAIYADMIKTVVGLLLRLFPRGWWDDVTS